MTDPAERWTLPPLTADDHCDWPACGVPAALRIILNSGDLYACAHHYRQHCDTLNAAAVHVQDERLTPRVGTEGLEDLGRMNMRRGLTYIDPCRWCCTRLVQRRTYINGKYRDYFICPVCDETAADMDSLKGLTL